MTDPGLALDAGVRLGFAVGLLLLFAVLEWLVPRRARTRPRSQRWRGNIGVQLLNALLERLLPWLAPATIAAYCAQHNVGLVHQFTLHPVVVLLLSVLVLDLVIYWQHRLFHRVPWLWRIHRMHHTDVDLDVTSAFRFHPMEIVASLLIKSCVIALLGIPLEGVLVFAIVLNGMALFNHANLGIPPALERWLRLLLVTPDMHRIHHSIEHHEHNRNFGFNLSCWDRLFGSYCARPGAGQQQMILGLGETNSQNTGSLLWMLRQPFQ